MSDSDVPAFAQACADWDRISPLDSWKTSLLVKARGTIMVEEEEVSLSVGGGREGVIELWVMWLLLYTSGVCLMH